jgi:hypothetical protein
MLGSLSTSAYQAIPEICSEIREFGEPANPALTRILKYAYQTLKTGGAVTGFYGYGKTLIAILSAAAENAAGNKAAVVAAYRVLSAEEGKVEIGELTIDAVEKLEETCGEDVKRWLGKALGLEPKTPGKTLEGRVEIKGKKLHRLLDLVHALKKAGATLIVVDEFEKVVQTPEYYGFKDLGDLLINFFEMVDRWPRPGAGYTIPSTLWAFLDLQTRRRVAPVYHLSMQITTDDMRKFLERKLGAVPEELKEVNFRNPAVVAEIVAEVKSRGVQTVIRDRFSWLGKVAYSYPKASEKTRRALHAVYISTWYMQNIYAEIPPSLLHKAADIAQSEDPAAALSKRRRKLLAKTPSGYMLTYPAVAHIREALTTPQRQQELELTYVADRLRLELEIP